VKKKIRIKYPDGRIQGPVLEEEFVSSLKSQDIPEGLLIQVFPFGEWVPYDIESRPGEYSEDKLLEKEFEFTIGTNETPDIQELSSKQSVETTKLIDARSFLNKSIDSTREIGVPKEETPKDDQEEVLEAPLEEEQKELVDREDSTKKINVSGMLKQLTEESESTLASFEQVEKTSLPNEQEPVVEVEEEKEKEKEVAVDSTVNFRSVFITALVGAGLIIYLLFEYLSPRLQDPQDIEIIPMKIRFPVTFEVENAKKSKEFYELGIKAYRKGNYVSKLKAINQFLISLRHKFQDNPALGNLILTYSELLLNVRDPGKEGLKLFRLILIAKSKYLKDINVVLGMALFYFHNKKYFTTLNVIENYLRVSKPSLKLLSLYLRVLLKTGNLVKAKKVYEKIKDIEYRPIESYFAIARFFDSDEQFLQGKKEIIKGIKNFKNSVLLYLEYCRYLVRDSQFKELEKILLRIKSLNVDQSPYYYSRFLEYMGIISAVKKKDALALKYFTRAIELHDSDELRSKLAAIKAKGESAIGNLVTESKIKQYMKLAEEKMKEKNWKEAFNYAIEASDLNEKYIPAQLLLAKIQVRRAFYKSALETLERIKKDFPNNKTVNYALIMAYIDSYKLDDVRKEIKSLAYSPLAKTSEYYSLLARYYLQSDNTALGMKNLIEALKLDPLNDENFYLLGMQYLKYRKYKSAKEFLARAIDLDPRNSVYRASWAKILYELDSAETAIGYLRDVLESNKEDTKILGDIAIYYYKSGQIKNFEEVKEKIEKKQNPDEGLYNFLIDIAKLENRVDDVIENSIKLIKLRPGNLQARMILGEYLIKINKWKKAEKVFEEVKKSLGSFPKVNYYLSKVYTKLKKAKKAEQAARLEIKENPDRAYGYYALGEVFRYKKDWLKASRSFEKAISIDPSYVEALTGLGWIRHRQNFYTEALELYSRAIKEEPSLGSLHRELGFLYKSMGQSGLAIESFETYLKLNPTARDSNRIKTWIKQLR
jgi:tetratricopeptide (TPR) repeat protein